MADGVITQGVTLASAAHIETLSLPELNEELHRVQRHSLNLAETLHDMNCRARDLNVVLHGLVDSYDKGDMVAVSDKLAELSGYRKAHMRQPTAH